MKGYHSLMPPRNHTSNRPIATSYNNSFGLIYYLKGGLAGGICCGITHGAMTPVDVVKTKIQLDPTTYNRGLLGGIRQVITKEGYRGLATGLSPTVVGYFVQGWFKFGGVEYFKIHIANRVGEQAAWNNRTMIYLASAAMAEFIADLFLCPLEATRIRLVSDPSFANGLTDGAAKLLKTEGFMKGFYSGFGPILFKQIPYTMAKFSVQGRSEEAICACIGTRAAELKGLTKSMVAITSGMISGAAVAVISHPADTLLSKVNKAGAGGDGSIVTRLMRISSEIGFLKLCTVGLGPRCAIIATLTAGQFLIFDMVMDITGARKFHFHDPSDKG